MSAPALADGRARPSELLEGLTPPQRQAVTTTEGPLLIIAAAGSGKTRVLTRRVGYLVRQGIEPSSVLAITFTNKAAGEMRERVAPLISDVVKPRRDFGQLDQRTPTLCTFHSLCMRVLRHYGDILGVPRNFNIYDTSDQQKLMKQALADLQSSATNFPPAKVLSAISNAKNALLTAEEFASTADDFYQRTVAKAYLKYEKLKAEQQALDFDDLILRVVLGLRARLDVLGELQERYQYLHIDEYQDTNRAQYILAHVLAEKHRNLCVVGDPDQSIYAWRGADLRNILDFEKDYPDAKVVKLETNYRSTAAILAVADKLIKHNTERRDKDLVPFIEGGDKIVCLACQDENDEAREVAERLTAFHEAGVAWGEMAVFYRMNSLSRVIEGALRRLKVPYQIAKGTEFYNRKEVKDVMAYLRVIGNPLDEVGLLRIVNTPTRGIGDASVKAAQGFAAANGLSLFEALRRIDEVPGVSSRGQNAVKGFVQKIDQWKTYADAATTEPALPEPDRVSDDNPLGDDLFGDAPATAELGASDATLKELAAKVIRESGLEAHHRQPGDVEQTQLENMNEVVNAVAQYEEEAREENVAVSLDGFLQQSALAGDTDRFEGEGGSVTLMTLHAAKGLEFPVVAMLGLEEGCLPHSRARDSLSELEEERRLAFVGITRAQRNLILSRAQYRTMRGSRERTVPSPFLKELPTEHLEEIDRTGLDGISSASSSRYDVTPRDDLSSRFKSGQKVRHTKFGVGKVLEVSPGSNARITIDFGKLGKKTLVLDIAASKLAAAG